MVNAGTVIIGAGVVGASVAYHLTERGATDVLILERETVQGLGSTGAATGGVRAQFETEINILMSVYSLSFFRRWHHECGYQPRGYLFFATTDDQLEYLRRNVETQRSLGVRDIGLVNRERIRELVPGMNCDDILGGSFGANDGFIDPLAVMEGFTKGALRSGAQIRFGTQVTKIIVNDNKIIGVDFCLGVAIRAEQACADELQPEVAVLVLRALRQHLFEALDVDRAPMNQRPLAG